MSLEQVGELGLPARPGRDRFEHGLVVSDLALSTRSGFAQEGGWLRTPGVRAEQRWAAGHQSVLHRIVLSSARMMHRSDGTSDADDELRHSTSSSGHLRAWGWPPLG
jgi:hypothetical protein